MLTSLNIFERGKKFHPFMAWCKVLSTDKRSFSSFFNKGFKTNHQIYWRVFDFTGPKPLWHRKNGFTSNIFIHNTERKEQKDGADPIWQTSTDYTIDPFALLHINLMGYLFCMTILQRRICSKAHRYLESLKKVVRKVWAKKSESSCYQFLKILSKDFTFT